MAEVIFIIGLAANIVQFLDLGSKFVSGVWKIYRSGRDAVGEIPDLAQTTGDLQIILKGFQGPDRDEEETLEGEHDLRQLAGECQTLATELLESLNKISPSGKVGKRDALSAAFRMVWKEEEIRRLKVRLEGFRQQLTLRLLALLR